MTVRPSCTLPKTGKEGGHRKTPLPEWVPGRQWLLQRATLQSCIVPAFSAPWCSCCMVGPDGAVAFFYGQGSNPARHRVNPSIQRPSHCLDYSSSLASPAGSFLIVNVSVVRDSNPPLLELLSAICRHFMTQIEKKYFLLINFGLNFISIHNIRMNYYDLRLRMQA